MDLIMGNMAGYAACNPEQERTKVLEQLKHDIERDLTMRSMEKNSRFWASYFKAKDKIGV